MRRRIILGSLALGVVAVGLIVAFSGTDNAARPLPPPLLRGPRSRVEANLQPLLRKVASRVERIRGLRFRTMPPLELMDERRLAAVGRRIARGQRRRADLAPAQARGEWRAERASVAFDQLAGLLPPEFSFGPDTRGGLDRIGGVFDYPRNRIILVRRLIVSRLQLDYTLAHELTHALESEHFRLRLGTLTQPGEAAVVRRAVVEGTATFVQNLYWQRYLHDEVPLTQRLEGMRSVIATAPGAYAFNAQTVFDYVDGALFVRSLYRRAGGWSLVNRALARPPRRSDQLLHPRITRGSGAGRPVRLGVAPLLRSHWRRLGGGVAGEERALVILLAGTISSQAASGASGWDGGLFGVWRPRDPASECRPGCARGDVGVIAFRWRGGNDAEQFSLAVPAYMVAGLLAEPVDAHTWKLSDGYASLASATHGSALAFAPTEQLAEALSRRAAGTATRGG